ncbi:hypothetical protein EDD86DRAFT_212622 [Gorgonomyces haynaldii]|nr:hypothetical protein EDD86DRAFT_212622 [Gorgonomyces haynaldii]
MNSELEQIIQNTKLVRQRLAALPIENTDRGMSLLALRSHLLSDYITHLSFLTLTKTSGKSTQIPAREHLASLRIYLEKTKPLETKLKYQIDKLVKQSKMDQEVEKQKDMLSFKPNPENLQEEDEEEKDDSQVYKPPKITPVQYDPMQQERKLKWTREKQEKASKSRLLQDLAQEYDDRPEELDVEGTGYSGKGASATKEDQEWNRRIALEEETMNRMIMTKKDKKLARMLSKQGGIHRFKNEFNDIQQDFSSLQGLHQQVEEEDLEFRTTAGRRKKRQQQFGELVQEKKAKYKDSQEMISKLSSVKRSMGKDSFSKAKRIVKKISKKKQ